MTQYADLCEAEASIPLYFQPWWLDIVCGDGGWGVSICKSNDQIVGAMPYFIKRKFGITMLTSPPFTQFLGIWIRSAESKYFKKLAREKEIISQLVEDLPKHQVFFQCFPGSFENWLPLYWKGFEQTTKYSYVLKDLSDLDAVWSDASVGVRTAVRKARQSLVVETDRPVSDLFDILQKTYERQGMKPGFSRSKGQRMVQEAVRRGVGKVFYAVDSDDQVHAAVFIVWDSQSAYYILGGGDPELRQSGGGTLCLWEAISFSSEVTVAFDFEGSMVEGIEKFFRSFGAKQQAYFRIRRFRPAWLGLLSYIRGLRTGKI